MLRIAGPIRYVISFIDCVFPESRLVEFQLLDMAGKLIRAEEARIFNQGNHQHHMDVKSLKPGCYLLLMKAGEERMVKKVVVGAQ
ncbi:MAG: T9SS type A sorting domain-containing protein [Bacteroidia bacterium]